MSKYIPEEFKVVTAVSANLYASAECLQVGCDWGRPPTHDSKTEARRHTKRTGHQTRIEQITRAVYERVENK